MSIRAIRSLAFRRARTGGSQDGSAMIGTLVIFVGLLGLVYASSATSITEVKDSRDAMLDVRADQLAAAGQERALQFLASAIKNSSVQDPMGGLTNLFTANATITPFIGEALMDGTTQVGSYTIALTRLATTATSITMAIESTGYLPDAPTALAPGERVTAWRATRSTVRYTLAPSQVFDYAYFINNWGWFYGNTIFCNGNARSNGQFDVAGYSPTITGQPLYDSVSWNGVTAALAGYQDDNNDGLQDGNDGGIWSGWDIVGAQNVQGNGGKASNQHDFDDPVPMPNLSDLSSYEANAVLNNSSITIGGVQVSDAVMGDEPGEKQNLYLVGTATNPIVINGPVVVRGDVIIRGVIQGQGGIYSGRNLYVPNSLNYKNPPTSTRPANNTQAATEAWLTANWNKDFVGFFAKENIVVGNYTNSTWQYYVNSWMNSSLNVSEEDSGADGIPNTRNGRDGIAGTADDDVLEGDGIFTVEHYSAEDAALGLIPPGKSVGDPIPGTGEDIDGDGVYDPGMTMADLTVGSPLDTTNWAGNMPSGGVSSYGTISSMTANNLDGVFYTNHSFCYVVLGSTTAKINGSVVSRNEDIIYGTPAIHMNHDSRLLGKASSLGASFLPRQIQPAELLRWETLDQDPNHYAVAP